APGRRPSASASSPSRRASDAPPDRRTRLSSEATSMSPVLWFRGAAGPAGLLIALAFASSVWLAVAAAPPASYDDPEPPGPETFRNSLGMKFVRVKAGKFLMGAAKGEEGAED